MRFLGHILSVLLVVFATASIGHAEFRLLSGDANDEPRGESINLYEVSADGTLVLFLATPPQFGSAAGITVGGLYRRNIATGALSFVGDNSVEKIGVVRAAMSDDGRYIAWSTSADSSSITHIYWRDTQTGVSVLVTAGADGKSVRPLLSGDGRYVVFLSVARNLIDDTSKLPASGLGGLYRYDSQTGEIDIVSLTSTGGALATGVSFSGGSLAAALSDYDFSRDGDFVVFTSDSNNVTPDSTTGLWVYRRHLGTGAVDLVNRDSAGVIAAATYSRPSISADGNRVFFLGSLMGIFGTKMLDKIPAAFGIEAVAKDMTSGEVWWVSDTLDDTALGTQIGSTVTALEASGDGTVVAMTANSLNLVVDDVFPDEGTNDSFDIYRVELPPSGDVVTTHVNRPFDGASVNIGLRSDGRLPRDGSYIAYATSDADVALDIDPPTTLAEQQAVGVGDFSGIGSATTTTSTTSTSTTSSTLLTSTTMPAIVCGDADGDGVVLAGDALAALRTSVQLDHCPLSRCDVNGDGKILAGDALATLQVSVGIQLELNCISG